MSSTLRISLLAAGLFGVLSCPWFPGVVAAELSIDDSAFRVRLVDGPIVQQKAALGRLSQALAPLGATVHPVVPAAATRPQKVQTALAPLSRWVTVEFEPAAWLPVHLALQTDREVELVEPRYRYSATAIPSDPRLREQAHLNQIRVLEAFDTIKTEGATLVAVVDGGTDWRHEDLEANIWVNPGEVADNGVDDDANGFVDDVYGWNFANDSPDPTGLPNMPSNARHGTHVAGIIGARTDNGVGIVGASWNARLLPVNVSAPEPIGGEEFFSFGMEGILYAALHGADIINASFGRTGRWSPFEAEVIRVATELGSLVVAAAGNLSTPDYFFPAYYPEAMAVTRVGPTDEVYFRSNTGSFVDVAAPGTRITSTFPNDDYGLMSGTSQAAALVSGIAALLQAQHPDWTPHQLREQVRWTTHSIDEQNPGHNEKLGTGRLDALAAVSTTQPGLRVVRAELVDTSGDGVVERTETARYHLTVRAELGGIEGGVLRLVSDDPHVVVLEDVVFLPRMVPGQVEVLTRPLEVYIPFNARTGALTELVARVQTGGREVHQRIAAEPLPRHFTVDTGTVRGSITTSGKLGYSELTRPGDPGGDGFHRVGEGTVLLGGSLLIGTGVDAVSDAMAGVFPISPEEDFRPPQFDAVARPDPPLADDHLRVSYADVGAENPLGVWVDHHLLGSRAPGRDRFLIHAFDIRARGAPVVDAHVGFLVNWELRNSFQRSNRFTWDPHADLLLVEDVTGGERVAGLAILAAPGATGWSWLHDVRAEGQDQPGIYDANDLDRKLSDEELYRLMVEPSPAMPEDPGGVASVVAAGPFSLDSGEPARFALVMMIADSEAELRVQVEEARAAYGTVASSLRELAVVPSLLPNIPNPFNPQTELRFSLPAPAHVQLSIYDARGRLVRNLLDEPRGGGVHPVQWSGLDAAGRPVGSGVYFVRLRAAATTDRRTITLIR